MKRLIQSVFLLFLSISTSHAWQGKVIAFTAGDRFTVQHQDTRINERIRLYGVYTPEMRQPFGGEAKNFTSKMIFDKVIKIEPVTTDQYGRTVVLVYLDGNRCLNEELVKAGYAWVYGKNCDRQICKDWVEMENKARKNKVNLWSQPHPVPPWEFRRNKSGGSSGQEIVIQPLDAFHGDTSSKVFHKISCKYYNCIYCTVGFNTGNEAVKAGYKPCELCRP